MEPIKRNDTGAAVEDVQQRLARIGLRALRGAPCQPESGKTAHGRRPCKKVPARDFHDSSFGLLPSLMQRSQDVSPCDRVVAGPMKPACVFGRNRFRGGKSPSAPYLPPPRVILHLGIRQNRLDRKGLSPSRGQHTWVTMPSISSDRSGPCLFPMVTYAPASPLQP